MATRRKLSALFDGMIIITIVILSIGSWWREIYDCVLERSANVRV